MKIFLFLASRESQQQQKSIMYVNIIWVFTYGFLTAAIHEKIRRWVCVLPSTFDYSNTRRKWHQAMSKKVKKLLFFCGNVALYQNPEMRLTNKGWGWWWYGWCYGNNNKVLMLYIVVLLRSLSAFFSLCIFSRSFFFYFVFYILFFVGDGRKKGNFFWRKIYIFSPFLPSK